MLQLLLKVQQSGSRLGSGELAAVVLLLLLRRQHQAVEWGQVLELEEWVWESELVQVPELEEEVLAWVQKLEQRSVWELGLEQALAAVEEEVLELRFERRAQQHASIRIRKAAEPW